MNNRGEFNVTFESSDVDFNAGLGSREEFFNPSFGSTTEIQIPGPPGPPGDKGDSAYEVAVKNGFEGTEEEWLESLKGKESDETISAEGIEIALGYKPANEKDIPTEEEKESWNNKSEFSGDYDDLSNKPKIPAKISDLENDSDFLTDYTEKDPTVPAWAKQPNKPTYTATDVGADPSGSAAQALKDSKAYTNQQIQAIPTPDVSGQINKHNTDTQSHNDIRILLAELIAQVNSFLDVDDTTRDQLSELLRDIDANKTSIESIVSGKVNVTDIINNLTTNVANKPLSAAQGVVLKNLIDTLQTAVNAIKVPTKTSDLENDSGFLTEHQSLDGYAKTADHYTKTASDNKYQPKGSYLTEIPSEYVTETELTNKGYAKQIEVDSLSEEIVDKQNQIDNLQPKGNYVKSVNGSTPDNNGNVELIIQAEAPTYVDSVDEMTDTSKSYVNTETGTIWTFKSSTVTKEVTVRDNIIGTTDNPYYENSRLGSDGSIATSAGSYADYIVTPYIDLTEEKYVGKTIELHLDGVRYASESAETYIMNQLLGVDKNVLIARNYTMLDTSDGILKITSGISLTINNSISATLTIDIPPIWNSTEIGYLRFCGKGAVANSSVYITYKEMRTITDEQWTDTGVPYGGSGGGVDEETLAKISELNNEGSDPTTIKLLAKPVLDFYNASAYSDSDYTTSHLEKITYPCRADIPVPFNVKWNHNEDAMRTTLVVDTKAIGTLNAYRMRIYDVTGFDNYPIYNLLPNTRYYYKVTHVLADGSLVEAKSGNFITSSETIRLIHIDGTQNVRDLGGWSGLNGKKVKYGKLIRGAALSDSSFNGLIVTGKGRLSLGELKIQAELNLGATDTETSIASNCSYQKVGYSNYATAITDSTARANFKTVIEKIVSWLSEATPRNVYFHCQGGCDRTGTLSFQLLGLLGVSESDLAKEYELSSFSDIGYGRRRNTTKAVDTYDYVGMVEAIKTYSGSTITDKFYNFAIACGVSADTITAFRNLMLE